jgi:hypothetical protein
MLFRRETMWQNAASYTATVGGTCGISLRELEEGRGELALFYDQASSQTRLQFETYVSPHPRPTPTLISTSDPHLDPPAPTSTLTPPRDPHLE